MSEVIESISAPVTAIVAAYQRPDQTLATLGMITQCKPPPAEILVHVDGNQESCASAIRTAFPRLRIIVSANNVGPGGARNKLIAAAAYEFVASFDDDSYPLDADYFLRIEILMGRFPEAAILSAAVFHQGELIQSDERKARWVSDFGGGACVYRRSRFLSTSGYVPLPVAYGMEEVDLAMRLHSCGERVLGTSWLRVFHDTDLRRHGSSAVTSASIANIALLTFLRYPVSHWPIGVGQLCKRVWWLWRQGRRAGIWSGLASIPKHCWRHRHYRCAVTRVGHQRYFRLRHRSETVAMD